VVGHAQECHAERCYIPLSMDEMKCLLV